MSTGPQGFPVTCVRCLFHVGMTRMVNRAILHLPTCLALERRGEMDTPTLSIPGPYGTGFQTRLWVWSRRGLAIANRKVPDSKGTLLRLQLQSTSSSSGLWSPAWLSHKEIRPNLSCTEPGKSLDCLFHFCRRVQGGPLS